MNKTSAMAIGPREDAIIRAVWLLSMLTADQVARLVYRPTEIEYVRRRLKLLAEAGYLVRKVVPRVAQHGSAPYVYLLGRRGVAYLRDLGHDIHYYPSDHDPHYLFLHHSLLVADILVTASLLRSVPAREMRGEAQLKPAPMRVTADTEALAIIPDAWIDFGKTEICLEADRGTEEGKVWRRRKVRGYVAAFGGEYQRVFERQELPTVAVVATPGPGRAETLRRWTEEELERRGREYAPLFLFTDWPGVPLDPEQFFCAPRWYEPYKDDPVPLLEA